MNKPFQRTVILWIVAAVVFFTGVERAGAEIVTPLQAISMAVNYLVSKTNEDGSFNYEYDPATNQQSESYNILRHAGAIYSMLEAYEVNNNRDALVQAEKAINFLLSKTVQCPTISEALCVNEDNEIKLGGNALAILALTKHSSVTGSVKYVDAAQKLARYLVWAQSPEGEFVAHKIDTATGTIKPFISEYYPGEAIFALARLSRLNGNKQWLKAAHDGARWVIMVRDAGKQVSQLPHDHWLLYALNELHKDPTENTLYVDHAKKIVDAIVATQHRDLKGAEADWNGGYYIPPRSTPTAIRSEGLCAAYHLFERAGAKGYLEKSFDALERGVAFQMRTFITLDDAQKRNFHSSSVGGFCKSLEECKVRVDYVQHNISALVGYEKIRAEREGRSPLRSIN